MAEITTASNIDELSVSEEPLNVLEGTGKRRIRVFLRAKGMSSDDTFTIPDHISDVDYIEGVISSANDGVVGVGTSAGTAITWTCGRVTAGTATYTGNGGTAESTFVCVLK